MKEKVYILGGAQTDFVRNWTKEGKGLVAILKEAVADGFQNANFSFDEMVELNKENRVAAFVGNFIAEQYISQGHLGAFLTEVNPAFMVYLRLAMKLLALQVLWPLMLLLLRFSLESMMCV